MWVCAIRLVHLQAFAKAKVSNEMRAGMSWTPYIQAGKAAGFRINFHGDELNPLGGAEMGASIQAEAISHLEEVRILKLNAWGIWCYSFGNMPSPNSFSDKSSWHSSYGSLWVSFYFIIIVFITITSSSSKSSSWLKNVKVCGSHSTHHCLYPSTEKPSSEVNIIDQMISS